MINVEQATSLADYECISNLAHTIWYEHYINIIALDQIEYMLEKYNSVKAIEQAVNNGVLFYYLTFNGCIAGYLAIEKGTDFIHISKLYVLKHYRGKKIAKEAMIFAEAMAIKDGFSIMKLHVNKYNTNSILAYTKMGFANMQSNITDIGNGFVMDDYLMVKKV